VRTPSPGVLNMRESISSKRAVVGMKAPVTTCRCDGGHCKMQQVIAARNPQQFERMAVFVEDEAASRGVAAPIAAVKEAAPNLKGA
jgi:hypothetical protein